MPTISATILFALLTVCAPTSAHATMYRWTDENGVTVYSQSPPPSGDAVRLKKQRAPSTETTKAAQEHLRLQREQAFDEEEARKKADAERAKKETEQAQRAENCTAAQENLAKFQNLGPRMIQTADGRFLRLSEDEIETQITKAQGQIDANCE